MGDKVLPELLRKLGCRVIRRGDKLRQRPRSGGAVHRVAAATVDVAARPQGVSSQSEMSPIFVVIPDVVSQQTSTVSLRSQRSRGQAAPGAHSQPIARGRRSAKDFETRFGQVPCRSV